MFSNRNFAIGRITIVFLATLMLLASTAWSATYYVDKNHHSADDGNSGTIDQPWRTIQHAANLLIAGDTVFVRAGVYYVTTISLKRSGEEGNPITFRNYPGETAIVDGQNKGQWAVVDWTADRNYIVWDGIDVRNGSNHGIRIIGDHNTFMNCKVYNNGPRTQSGILIKSGDYNAIIKNESYNNHNGIMIANCNYTTIEYNIVRDNTSHTGIDFLPNTSMSPQVMWKGNIARYNIVYNNNHGIYSRYQQHNEYSNNLIYDNIVQGIYFAPHPNMQPKTYAGYTKVYNNTIVGNGKNGIYDESTTHLTIKNNIFAYNANYDIYISSGKTSGHDIDYNLYFDSTKYGWAGTQSTLSAWRSVSGHGQNSLEGNPGFINRAEDDYSIAADSKAIDQGVDLSADGVTVDINGVFRPQGDGVDIGTYEFDEGATGNQQLPVPLNLRIVAES